MPSAHPTSFVDSKRTLRPSGGMAFEASASSAPELQAWREDSDLDFVVEFETKSFDAYMDLKAFLEQLFGCPRGPHAPGGAQAKTSGNDPQRSPPCPGTLGVISKTSCQLSKHPQRASARVERLGRRA